jgi:hypothetical protein
MVTATQALSKSAQTSSKSEPKSKIGKEEMVNIADLKKEVFVRESLNEDRVFSLAMQFEEDPSKVPAIKITLDKSIIAGRHRIAGAELAGRTQIKAEYVHVKDIVDHITQALSENVIGPLQYSRADLMFTAKNLLSQKVSRIRVVEILTNQMTRPAAQKLVDEARHGIYRDNLAAAKRAIRDRDLKVSEAAKEFGIDLEKLKEEMGGKKSKKKEVGVGDAKRNLSSHYRSYSSNVTRIVNQFEKQLANGDASLSEMSELLNYLKASAKRFASNLADVETRISVRYDRKKK